MVLRGPTMSKFTPSASVPVSVGDESLPAKSAAWELGFGPPWPQSKQRAIQDFAVDDREKEGIVKVSQGVGKECEMFTEAVPVSQS